MKRFQFRLETVLRHRKTIETLREQDFATAQGMLAGIEAQMTALRADYRATLAARPGSVAGETFDAGAIFDRERYLATLLAGIVQQERNAEAARIVCDEMRRGLVLARQARESVSRLRDKDLLAHTALTHKLEQAALDELATLRHARAHSALAHEEQEAAEEKRAA